MKVLHLAPLWFRVSHESLGGIETFLTALIAALEKQGCQTTLIATGDSRTDAELVSATPANLFAEMAAKRSWEYPYYEQHQLTQALELAGEVDVIHSHLGWGGLALSAVPGIGSRVLHTQHNPVTPDLEWFVQRHPDFWYSTVSEFQARKYWEQGATRCRVIPNGIDFQRFAFALVPSEELVFLGRIEWEKGTDLAVRVARELGRDLTIAGPIIEADFFENEIKPHLSNGIRYVGPIDHDTKSDLLGRAACVLMPSRVDEGCPIVPMEAMACGTPVVALPNGALPEIIDRGVTGYVTAEERDLSTLTLKAMQLDRRTVWTRAADRFDAHSVARRYIDLYSDMIAADTRPAVRPGARAARELS